QPGEVASARLTAHGRAVGVTTGLVVVAVVGPPVPDVDVVGVVATVTVTWLPWFTHAPAPGLVPMTVPLGLLLSVLVTTRTVRPRSIRMLLASPSLMPRTLGTWTRAAGGGCSVWVGTEVSTVVGDGPGDRVGDGVGDAFAGVAGP